MASALEEVVDDYTTKIEASEDVSERKALRSKRKTPKQITRFSVRGKTKVKNEIGLALMATNLRKYTKRGA